MAQKKQENARIAYDSKVSEMISDSRTKCCQRCGRIFHYSGFGHIYCDLCREVDTKEFETVKDYLYSHPLATMLEVEDNTGVIMKKISNYLREGRLEIPEGSPIFIKCELCKAEIRYGRVCPTCAEHLTAATKQKMDFDEYQVGEMPKQTGKMRFFNRDK